MKKTVMTVIGRIVLFCAAFCCQAGSAAALPLGDALPVWLPDGAYTATALPDPADDAGLIGIYTSDSGPSDVYVYGYPADGSVTLEAFGQQKAAERNVFCNMMTDRGVPAAVLNFHDCVEGEHYIVQAYIYADDEGFVEVRTMFKTEDIPLGGDDLSIHMIREYDAQEQKDSPLLFDAVYETDDDRLPRIRIQRFNRDDFPAGIIEPALTDVVSDDAYAALAADGWTLEEFVSLYGEGFDLLKGEVTRRNDLDHAFIGYIDGGVFNTRAFIDDGEDYLLIRAEAEAAKFRHITNALIDAVEANRPE